MSPLPLFTQTWQPHPPPLCFTQARPGWTVKSLLRHVARAEPRLSALIDTGALITGLSNKEVARYLLAHGLGRWCEGVVFLDEVWSTHTY